MTETGDGITCFRKKLQKLAQEVNRDNKSSSLFFKIVEDLDDIQSQIAYCLYKIEKAEFISQVTEEKGKPPSDNELLNFQKYRSVPGYKAVAESVLNNFYMVYISDALKILEGKEKKHEKGIEKAKRFYLRFRERQKALKRKEKFYSKVEKALELVYRDTSATRGTFWFSVASSLMASLLWALLLILLGLIIGQESLVNMLISALETVKGAS